MFAPFLDARPQPRARAGGGDLASGASTPRTLPGRRVADRGQVARAPGGDPRADWRLFGSREDRPISRIRCQVLAERPTRSFLLGQAQTAEAPYLLGRYRDR